MYQKGVQDSAHCSMGLQPHQHTQLAEDAAARLSNNAIGLPPYTCFAGWLQPAQLDSQACTWE